MDEFIEKIDKDIVSLKKEIGENEILTLIKAARLAPSADNSQVWRFLIIRNKDWIDKILTYFNDKETECSTIIVAVAAPFFIKHLRREQPFYAIDVPIAITHILLQGIELGIKTRIRFVFEDEQIKELLNIPHKFKPVAILIMNKYAD